MEIDRSTRGDENEQERDDEDGETIMRNVYACGSEDAGSMQERPPCKLMHPPARTNEITESQSQREPAPGHQEHQRYDDQGKSLKTTEVSDEEEEESARNLPPSQQRAQEASGSFPGAQRDADMASSHFAFKSSTLQAGNLASESAGTSPAGRTQYQDAWDDQHVRMPCSPRFKSKREGPSQWEVIQTALSQPVRCFQDLRSCILSYTVEKSTHWEFNTLEHVIHRVWDTAERRHFFEVMLPNMIKLAMSLPELCPTPIPMLAQDRSASLSLSQHQCASLLANGFLCTFPRGSRIEAEMPSVNFHRLFDADTSRLASSTSKLLCIMQYFKVTVQRLIEGKALDRKIVIERRVLDHNSLDYASDGQRLYRNSVLDWQQSVRGFGCVELDVRIDEKIEDFDPQGHVWQASPCRGCLH
jgi:hypothetical protein